MLHGLYLIVEALKLAIGVVAVYWITRSRPERGEIGVSPQRRDDGKLL